MRRTKPSTKLMSGGSCKPQMPEERGNGSFKLQILLLSHGLGVGGSGLSSPTSAPRFQMRTKPTMCHCQRPITAGNVEKPGVTGVETSCLFSLGSSQEQELLQICCLSPWVLSDATEHSKDIQTGLRISLLLSQQPGRLWAALQGTTCAALIDLGSFLSR